MEQQERSKMLGSMKMTSLVPKVSVPIMISMLVQALYNVVDSMFVAKYDPDALTAVSLAYPIQVLMIAVSTGLGVGINSLISRRLGEKRVEDARDAAKNGFFLLLLGYLLFLIFGLFFDGLFFRMSTKDETLRALGETYTGIVTIFSFGLFFSIGFERLVQATGNTMLSMIMQLVGAITNIILDPIMIFGYCGCPKMGIAGAAIATVLSRYIETAIIVVYTHTQKEYFSFIHGAYRSLRVPSPLMSGILRRGTPLLVNEFLWSSGMAVLLQCYSVRGLDVVAACNIATTVSNLFKVVFLSMGNAVAIMVGQALGANDIERAKNCTWRLMTAAVGSNLFMSILLILFAPSIPHIYNTEPHVRQIATQLLYVIAMMMPAYSFSHCCYFTLRSGGKTVITFLFDSGFTWVVSYPAAYLLVTLTSLPIVWVVLMVQFMDIIKCILGFVLLKKGVWIHNMVAK